MSDYHDVRTSKCRTTGHVPHSLVGTGGLRVSDYFPEEKKRSLSRDGLPEEANIVRDHFLEEKATSPVSLTMIIPI